MAILYKIRPADGESNNSGVIERQKHTYSGYRVIEMEWSNWRVVVVKRERKPEAGKIF
jgi:hypothetical protein